MEFNSYPDLSPEYSYAHKIAAKELLKYCQEFDRWRASMRPYEALAKDPRRRGLLVPDAAGKLAPHEHHSAD